MNKRQAANYINLCNRLYALGLLAHEIDQLLRIQRTLHRWAELECGDEHGNAIERDEITGKPFRTFERITGLPRGRYPVADRKQGALRRLAGLLASHPDLAAYHQSDPRGCALYIVRKADLADGAALDSVYNARGIALCY